MFEYLIVKYFSNFFLKFSRYFFDQLLIFILAKYKESPFAENAIIMLEVLTKLKFDLCSIKIFFTAGSKSQAIPDVLPATVIDKIS